MRDLSGTDRAEINELLWGMNYGFQYLFHDNQKDESAYYSIYYAALSYCIYRQI
ncbi:hypothetical protein D3C81_984490 [compost metagenome]